MSPGPGVSSSSPSLSRLCLTAAARTSLWEPAVKLFAVLLIIKDAGERSLENRMTAMTLSWRLGANIGQRISQNSWLNCNGLIASKQRERSHGQRRLTSVAGDHAASASLYQSINRHQQGITVKAKCSPCILIWLSDMGIPLPPVSAKYRTAAPMHHDSCRPNKPRSACVSSRIYEWPNEIQEIHIYQRSILASNFGESATAIWMRLP